MAEARAVIKDIKAASKTIEDLGGESKGKYSFTDIIFIGKNNDDLNKEFVRLRAYQTNNWDTKKYVLVQKKQNKSVLKKQFPTEQEAMEFIHTYFKVNPAFEYFRTGEEWELDGMSIFVEDIKDYKPTIEIESKDKEAIDELFMKIGIVEVLEENLPSLMKTILQD